MDVGVTVSEMQKTALAANYQLAQWSHAEMFDLFKKDVCNKVFPENPIFYNTKSSELIKVFVSFFYCNKPFILQSLFFFYSIALRINSISVQSMKILICAPNYFQKLLSDVNM